MLLYHKVSRLTIVEEGPKDPFSITTTSRCRGGRYSFLLIAPLILDPYLIMLSIKEVVRRTRHAGHCWRSKDELISDVLLWTPTHGCASVGRPARTYIQQLCEDTGCNPEDLPEAMNDREKWRETVRDIRAGGAT